jgi:hypothetical protein
VSGSNETDYCAFSAEHTSPEHQQWRSWCGPAAK